MTGSFRFDRPMRVVVTGATGQDARFLIPILIDAGAEVHAIARDVGAVRRAFDPAILSQVNVYPADLSDFSFDVADLLRRLRPDYLFNLAGQSSVRDSLAAPDVSWAVNALWTERLLEGLRLQSPATRLYQASSSEMFGAASGGVAVHDEESPLRPVTPYAGSKAAAHLLCQAYRQSYGLRIACGILFNHESKYRPAVFLTSKMTSHVRSLRVGGVTRGQPLRVGNLELRRDWGYAGEFARGILLIAAQIAVRSQRSGRAEADESQNYRDYVLATCRLTSVRELVDRAFVLSGFDLDWELDGAGAGRAFFRGTRTVAVESAPEFFRPGEPLAIAANARRAVNDLGWQATPSVDLFLTEMLGLSQEPDDGLA